MQKEGMGKIKEMTLYNLEKTLEILKWNIDNNIFFYRASSDLVPFATHPEMTWDWWSDEDLISACKQIKELVKKHDVRLTTHPGQYSVLNSPNIQVVDNCIKDFEYHAKLMDLMGGVDMITHVGGVYGDKERAKERWVDNYTLLSKSVQEKLRLENDDRSFTITDVLDISKVCGVPVVLDIHHHNCNPCEEIIDDLLDDIFNTWGNKKPKMHISSGKTSKTDISHHDYISDDDFDYFLSLLKGRSVDIMCEAKKKELSIVRLGKAVLV
jgi:UV DNA damage endonuclease